LADLLSRSGHGLDATFDQLRKIQGVKNAVNPVTKIQGAVRTKLPIASIAAPIIGKPIEHFVKKKVQDILN